MTDLFPFVELEFSHAIGPAPGRQFAARSAEAAWKALDTGGYGYPGARKYVVSFVGFLPAAAR